MAGLSYNAGEEQESSFDVLPAGEYVVVISNSDYKPNKKGTGMLLSLEYSVIDGDQKGAKVFEHLSPEHENAQAAAIAQRALNSIMLAVGLKSIKDTTQLHDRPLKIEVHVKEDAQYGKQNKIKRHIPMDGVIENKPAPAAGGKKKQPWEK
jgi:hypothetical protein